MQYMAVDYLVLIKLVFAHFLADFCFQTDSFVRKKKDNKQSYHLLHALIHAVSAYLLAGHWDAWFIPVSIALSHYLIDLWKYRQSESLKNFMIDQLLHLLVLTLLWLVVTRQSGAFGAHVKEFLTHSTFWIYLTGFVFILKPTSVILGISTRKWEEGRGNNGLTNAGQWIGYLERTLVLIFICISVYEAIGFILAAKSIYRFGELKEADDIKKTEYIMIGTFLSFTIAVLVGLAMKGLVG